MHEEGDIAAFKDFVAPKAAAAAAPKKAAPAPTAAAAKPAAGAAAAPKAPAASKPAASQGGKVAASPLARKLAVEKGIDLSVCQVLQLCTSSLYSLTCKRSLLSSLERACIGSAGRDQSV